MVSIKQGQNESEFTLSCDNPRCVRAEMTTLPSSVHIEDRSFRLKNLRQLAREKLELNSGWWTERFPKKPERDFCPTCAPPYRTAFARITGVLRVFFVLVLFAASACGEVEGVNTPDAQASVRGKLEEDAGPLLPDLGTGGSQAIDSGAGGAAGQGAGGVAGSPGAGGSGGADAGHALSCEDLLACCNTQPTSNLRNQCFAAYNAVSSGGTTSCVDVLKQIPGCS